MKLDDLFEMGNSSAYASYQRAAEPQSDSKARRKTLSDQEKAWLAQHAEFQTIEAEYKKNMNINRIARARHLLMKKALAEMPPGFVAPSKDPVGMRDKLFAYANTFPEGTVKGMIRAIGSQVSGKGLENTIVAVCSTQRYAGMEDMARRHVAKALGHQLK